MASPNLSELISTTLRYREGKLYDSVSDNIALLSYLKKNGNVKKISGGRTIVVPLSYAENSTYQWYSGYDTLDISPSDVLTAAEYEWKQGAVTVSISGLEQIQNSGKEQVIDMLAARVTNAEQTFMNNMSIGIYSNGTGSGGKTIHGLQLLVPDDPTTGTAGGIPRPSWTFWQSKKFSGTTDGGAAVSAANIEKYINRLVMKCRRGPDKPDVAIADDNYFGFLWDALQAKQRVTSASTGESGFETLKYAGMDVLHDGGNGGACPANHMYVLNSKHIKLYTHKDYDMKALPEKSSINQHATVKTIVWAGNLGISCAFVHGVLIA